MRCFHNWALLPLLSFTVATCSTLHGQITPPVMETVIPVGLEPVAAAVNPKTNRVYVSNQGDCTVSVIDGTRDVVIANIPIAGIPGSIAVNPITNRVYVGTVFGATADRMFVIDAIRNSIIAALPISVMDIAVNPTTNRIYVTNNFGSQLTVVNGVTNKIISTSPGPWDLIDSIAVNPRTNRIYASAGFEIYVIDGVRNTIITSIPVDRFVVGMVVNPGNNRLYAAGDEGVEEIDGNNNSVIGFIPIGGIANISSNDIEFNPTTNRFYVSTSEHQGSIVVLDAITRTIVDTLRVGLAQPARWRGSSVATLGQRVYLVSNYENSVTSIQDPPLIGGQHFGLRPRSDGVFLTWAPGTLETGYSIVRWGAESKTFVLLPRGGPLPKGSTSYLDDEPRTEELYLYGVLPQNASGHLWPSNLVGVQPNTQSGLRPPTDFALRQMVSGGEPTNLLTWKDPISEVTPVSILCVGDALGFKTNELYSRYAVDSANVPKFYTLYAATQENGKRLVSSTCTLYSVPLWALEE